MYVIGKGTFMYVVGKGTYMYVVGKGTYMYVVVNRPVSKKKLFWLLV